MPAPCRGVWNDAFLRVNASHLGGGNSADAAISSLPVAPADDPAPAVGAVSVAAAPVPQPVTAPLTSAAIFLVLP